MPPETPMMLITLEKLFSNRLINLKHVSFYWYQSYTSCEVGIEIETCFNIREDTYHRVSLPDLCMGLKPRPHMGQCVINCRAGQSYM